MRPVINKQTPIAVIYGGLSSEREASLEYGASCYEALLALGYENVYLIDLDRHIDERLRSLGIEVAYLALLGRYGEDGCIQGMLEIMGIPYTGSRVAASAVGMNKDLTKRLLIERGLPVLPSVTVTQNDPLFTYRGSFPAVVKPVCEGSSIGIVMVQDPDELEAALQAAFRLDRQVMIEQYLHGRNLTVGVLDLDGMPHVTPIREMIPRSAAGWYDYEAKYADGKAEFVCPADLPAMLSQSIRNTTLAVHQALGCSGLSRTDYLLGDDGRYYVLEINTLPALTRHANFPAQVAAMGLDYPQMVEAILMTARLEDVPTPAIPVAG